MQKRTVPGPWWFNLIIVEFQNRIYDRCTLVQYADDCVIVESFLSSIMLWTNYGIPHASLLPIFA